MSAAVANIKGLIRFMRGDKVSDKDAKMEEAMLKRRNSRAITANSAPNILGNMDNHKHSNLSPRDAQSPRKRAAPTTLNRKKSYDYGILAPGTLFQ